MKRSLLKYLSENFSDDPVSIDRLFVSTYIIKNKIAVKKNVLLQNYTITTSNKKEYNVLLEFIAQITVEKVLFDIEDLIEFFEFVISPRDRIVNGAVYTTSFVREYILDQAFRTQLASLHKLTLADIACGCGGFLYTAAKQLKKLTGRSYFSIYKEQLFGLDIQNYSVVRTQLLLSLLAVSEGEDIPVFEFNLFQGNALNFNWYQRRNNFLGFNVVVGNPPYVSSRNIDVESNRMLANWKVCSSGHPDLYIPFFQIGLELLSEGGTLGYITMNSFFKSLNGRSLREYFHEKRYSFQIVDFGALQIFNKRSTYTCICLISNTTSENVCYYKAKSLYDLKSKPLPYETIPYEKLKWYNGWNLMSMDLVNKIESVGEPFSKRFITRNGIATLKNDIYIFKPVFEDDNFYWLQNGDLYPIEKSICKEVVNPNLLTTEKDISKIKQKLIFPYEFVDGKAKIFTEKRLQKQFPFAFKYLKSKRKILASRDKGNGKYPEWFAFGRTQSLELMRYKLFFPHITPHSPNFIINEDEYLFFYNGIAVIGENKRELLVLKKLMSSRLFWYYLKQTSKPYTSGYISMSKNYIKDFGVYNFTSEETQFILSQTDQNVLNTFFEEKYKVELPIEGKNI